MYYMVDLNAQRERIVAQLHFVNKKVIPMTCQDNLHPIRMLKEVTDDVLGDQLNLVKVSYIELSTQILLLR